MTELVALLSVGKGSWAEVGRLIKSQTWEKIFLIGDSFASKFNVPENAELILVDFNLPLVQLRDDMGAKLLDKIKGLEVAVNIISGEGKSHMALLGALIKSGVGFRIVAAGDSGVEEI